VLAAAANMAQSAITAAMGRLKEGSPSKVFQEIGENVDQGFIDGVAALAPEVEAAVGDLMEGVGETATAGAVDAFAGLATLMGAEFERAYGLVEAAQIKGQEALNDAEGQFQRAQDKAERQFQRKLQDLREEAGRATVKNRAEVLQKIAQLEENYGRQRLDMAEAQEDKLYDLQLDAADNVRKAEAQRNLERGKALRDFQRDVEGVQRDTANRAAEIGRKAGQAISDAMRDAADSIVEARDRADEAIASLNENQAASRELRGVRDTFAAGQDEESKARDRAQETADLEYNLKRDLEKAKLKLGRDRGKAETEDDRRQLDIQYAEEVQNLKDSFEEAKRDLARRRAIADDNDAFRKRQQQALQAFNDNLEDAALKKQIERIQEERDSRITEINRALDEKIVAIRRSEADEREELRRSSEEKLNDLRTKFYDRIGDLNEESKTAFEALFGGIKAGVEAATGAVLSLSAAINAIPQARQGDASDGATWGNQPQAVRDAFTAAYGAQAEARWGWEHSAELAGMPKPTNFDAQTGRPTGEGFYQPMPDTEYWRANAGRFDPLPWGTEYPEQAYSSSDTSSRDVFGGNNASAYDEYATGGMVPGAAGRPRLAVVHGGEGVFTPEQMAVLGSYMSGGGGDHGHDIVLDGQIVGRTLEPYVSGSQGRVARLELG
jgi:hypothetical protein